MLYSRLTWGGDIKNHNLYIPVYDSSQEDVIPVNFNSLPVSLSGGGEVKKMSWWGKRSTFEKWFIAVGSVAIIAAAVDNGGSKSKNNRSNGSSNPTDEYIDPIQAIDDDYPDQHQIAVALHN